jgi:hypothetical protein
MINCPNCNAELPDKAKFCITCGNKIDDLPQPVVTQPKPSGEESQDKMSLLKAKLNSFKAKSGPPPENPAGIYSTNGYKEQYAIDRGSYQKPVMDDVVTASDFNEEAAPTKVVMKPAGAPAGPPPQAPPAPPPPQAPPPQQAATTKNSLHLKAGLCYLIEENKPKFCFQIFAQYAGGDKYPGLSISRINPKRLKEEFNVKDEAVLLWLTDSTNAGDNTIPPSLERITYDIKSFIGKNKDNGTPLVVFDGLEYLLSNNPFNPVIRFLRHLVDECSVSDSVMLIPLSPLAISQQELKMLEREFDVVERD